MTLRRALYSRYGHDVSFKPLFMYISDAGAVNKEPYAESEGESGDTISRYKLTALYYASNLFSLTGHELKRNSFQP